MYLQRVGEFYGQISVFHVLPVTARIVGQPCLDDVAFLSVDGFCAESGNLDVGVSDAKEFKSVVHEHFKAFFRK